MPRRRSTLTRYFGQVLKLLYKKAVVGIADLVGELGVSEGRANNIINAFIRNSRVKKILEEQGLDVIYASKYELGYDLIEGGRKFIFLVWKDTGEPLIAPIYTMRRVAMVRKAAELAEREEVRRRKALRRLEEFFEERG